MAVTGSRPILYLPDLCAEWTAPTTHLVSDDFPVQAASVKFPFPPPVLYGPDPNDATKYISYTSQPVRFAANQLALAPRHTSSEAKTRSAPAVVDLRTEQGGRNALTTVKRCFEMWGRSVAFALGEGQTLADDHVDPTVSEVNGRSLTIPPPDINDEVPELTINAWDAEHQALHPLPDPGTQAQAICALYEHYCVQLRQPIVLVNSEPSIRTEFYDQFLTPIEFLLWTRFNIPASNFKSLWDDLKKPYTPPTESQIAEGVYPFFSCAIKAEHRNSSLEATNGSINLAGFPDHLLFTGGAVNQHPVSVEVKTWWSYNTESFISLWTDPSYGLNADGTIEPQLDGTANIFEQVWNQSHFFQSPFGYLTNGEIVALYLRTGPNELTFSHPRPWTDPEALVATTGITFAGVLSKAPGADLERMIDELCPPVARRTPAQEGLMQDEPEH